jgi:hypothetical protein
MLLALLLVFTISGYATTCFEPTIEQAIDFARQDNHNALIKGFLCGLMVAAYFLNFGWYVFHTKRWLVAILFSLLTLPVIFAFAMAELLSSGCEFGGGLDGYYYFIPLAVLMIIGVGQIYWTSQRTNSLSILGNNR